MKMPNYIPEYLLAPCGINCMLCHHHCKSDQPCQGCREGKGKSKHCKSCKIMECVKKKGIMFCIECETFPCKLVKEFNAYYIERYGHEFLPNATMMKHFGKEKLIMKLCKEWACPECGGIICIHDNKCSECGKPY